MKKVDARSLKPEVQQQLRNQAIRLRRSGRKHKEIAEIVGVHLGTVCKWCKIYEREGAKGVRIKKRGRKLGSHRTMTDEQEKHIRKLIQDKVPDQLKLSFALWTRIAVQQLINRIYSINMPIRTVGEYLNRWGFTPQKPLRRAYEQNPKAVQKWLEQEYPKISKRAKKESAEVHWGDETGLNSDCYHGRSYAPRGKTPAIRLCAKREHINLISSVTNQGKVRFMIYKNTMNSQIMIKFLKRLVKDADRKVFLVLDNLRVHHSHMVRDWLSEHEDQIELFFLPSYSPELNPDEYLNCDLKAGVHSGVPSRSKKQLTKKAFSHLRMLQKRPDRVCPFGKREQGKNF